MTISSEVRKAGPYDGDDVTTSFPFSFKVFSADDVVVVLTDPAGIETTLTGSGTDYSVTLNADQDTAPGGTVEKVSALATDYLLTITSSVPNLQPLDLTNQGGFYPKVINAALDRLTILAQQNAEQIGRSVKVPISSSVTPDSLIAQLTQDAATAAAAASSASASQTAAATSATNAANSATAAAASYDSFDDRYLGAKAADPTTDNDGNALLVGALYWNSTAGQMRAWDGAAWQVPYMPGAGLFYKTDPTTVAFTKTGAGTASIKAGTKVDVAGTTVTFVAATAITMPALTAGTDYAIWVKDDATIQATTNFSTAPGAGNWRKVGGFHYAPGGNAAAVAGGDTTPAINAYSFWDLKFRPAVADPRGMTLVADSFWADIYLLGVDHLTNGTSKYNVSIADGSAPPKIPTKFGGDGSAAYRNGAWYNFAQVMTHHGKRLPNYNEFQALAFGTTEATSSGGTDVPTTGVNGTGATSAWNIFTSKWGVVQASGCLWTWGNEFGGVNGASKDTANTGGRGSVYAQPAAALFGGAWLYTSDSGSRAAIWSLRPSASLPAIGARGVCDHLILE
ncbi:hypothetical protein [Bordetella parapertussis]|uniref:Major tropism determinant second domain-containing protein n=1 Tax=Bordetella parapertussis (strain Bpp5) TaxID=1208660 RepID=K0MCE9_BORPB|nr:hypothetical protein [Bordetella parapertussis]CCJ48974.1 Hypothetical protein BN117_1641 [Bordetella parapertussis Bpp5]